VTHGTGQRELFAHVARRRIGSSRTSTPPMISRLPGAKQHKPTLPPPRTNNGCRLALVGSPAPEGARRRRTGSRAVFEPEGEVPQELSRTFSDAAS